MVYWWWPASFIRCISTGGSSNMLLQITLSNCRGDMGVVVVFHAEIVPEYECVWQDVWAELGRPCGIHQKQVSSLCSHYFTF